MVYLSMIKLKFYAVIKLWVLLRIITAYGMLLHAFPSMFVSSLRKFPENCVYGHVGFNCFIEYLHRQLLTANFLSYDIESA
jgi:hypothetical protein